MVELKLIDDHGLIEATLMHPKVFKHISEYGNDSCICDSFDGLIDFWGVFSDGMYYGMFRIDFVTSTVREIHTALLPSAYGCISKEARAMMEERCKNFYRCKNLITKVPSDNKLALKFAKDGGMTEVGVIKNGWTGYNGIVDLILLQKDMEV